MGEDDHAVGSLHQTFRTSKNCCVKKKEWRCFMILIILCVLVFASMLAWQLAEDRSLNKIVVESSVAQTSALKDLVETMIQNNTDVNQIIPKDADLNIEMRQDFRISDCNNNKFKESFPDIDYSLLGYNALRGFPLATGHDPGFTLPIFTADYSTHAYSADCRYNIPEGFVVIPDVSCMTSFTSNTIQSTYQFSKSLAVSATLEGSGFGASFSASTGYKKSSSEISSGESVFIISTAQCSYYFSKILRHKPPRFHGVFVDWIYKLNASNAADKDLVYINFLDEYGTHFSTEVTFGARYTYQHKMSRSEYKNETSSGINVAVQAGYSALVSVKASFNLDSEQKKSLSRFENHVETKTFTVGAAPPENGDAMKWASEVKSSPVPTKYNLAKISDLFTEQYMGSLGVDHLTIRKSLEKMYPGYCLHLKQKGELDSCSVLKAGLTFKNTRLINDFEWFNIDTETLCVDKCLEIKNCVAVSFCGTCTTGRSECWFFSEATWPITARKEGSEGDLDSWSTTIFMEKIQHELKMKATRIEGIERGIQAAGNLSQISNETCRYLCIADQQCVGFSYYLLTDQVDKCYLYSESSITGLIEDDDYVTVFLSYDLETTASTTSKTTSTTTPRPKTSTTN